MQEQIDHGFQQSRGYVNIVFAGWLHALNDTKAVKHKHQSLHNELKVLTINTSFRPDNL